MSQDFWLLVFFHESVSPQPQNIPLVPFEIFFDKSRHKQNIAVDKISTLTNIAVNKISPSTKYHRRQNIAVDGDILLKVIFCRQRYFVDAAYCRKKF